MMSRSSGNDSYPPGARFQQPYQRGSQPLLIMQVRNSITLIGNLGTGKTQQQRVVDRDYELRFVMNALGMNAAAPAAK